MTTPTPEQIASIVAGLSEAQRRALQAARPDRGATPGFGTVLWLPTYRNGCRLIQSLAEARLAKLGIGGASVTPLGEAVRAHLQKGAS